MNVKLKYGNKNWPRDVNKHVFHIGEVVDVKKNDYNFTEVLVRFDDGLEYSFPPSYLEITADGIV